MSLKRKISSGIVCISMLFSCACVKAEYEVDYMRKKIYKSVGVMSLNTNAAWDIYLKLVETYRGDLSDIPKFFRFYDVALELEHNLKLMPIRDEDLEEAISALILCYQAQIDEYFMRDSEACEKWRIALQIYRTLSLKFEDEQDTRMFGYMSTFCEYFEILCIRKCFCYDEFYKNFIVELFENIAELEKDFCVNFERISNIEKYAIYKLLEPLRRIDMHEGTMTSDVFSDRISAAVNLINEVTKNFKDRCKKSPEFVNKLENEMNRILKLIKFFEESSNGRRVLLYHKALAVLFRIVNWDIVL